MKRLNKILTALLTTAILFCMTGFAANAAVTATAITFSKTFDASLRVGYAITRAAVTTPEGLAVSYTSSDASIAAVNENGRVVGKKPGKAVITATAGGLSASYNVVVQDVSTKVFDGIAVTVLDKTTPAVSMRGRTNDRNVMCFVSADNQEVGVISYSDSNVIIQNNRKVVNLPGGGTYGAPPVDGKSWEAWFADEFNKYRGLDAGSREEAVATNNAETVEKYRQEVIKLVNEEREKAGLTALYADDKAMEYAQVRAQELTISFSHTRPGGLEKPYDEIGAMNENIADGSWGYTTPSGVMYRWMDSPGHRANILNEDAYAIGVGCYRKGDALMWVQEFLW